MYESRGFTWAIDHPLPISTRSSSRGAFTFSFSRSRPPSYPLDLHVLCRCSGSIHFDHRLYGLQDLEDGSSLAMLVS